MLLTRRAALGAGSAIFATAAAAQTQGTETQSAVQQAYESRMMLEEALQGFIERSGLKQQAGVTVEVGMAPVDVRGDNPQWVRARSIAFDAALLDAQSKIVKAFNTTIATETIRRVFRAADADLPTFPPEALERPGVLPDLMRRIVGLARGRLDAELRELGVDPAEFERAPEPRRAVLASNAIRSRTTIRAISELAGFTAVQTFETHDGNGNFQIGTVVVGSERTKGLVRQIQLRRGQFEPDLSRATDIRALVQDRRALVDDFGVRLLMDQAGLPVIVSFAQWGIAYGGNDRNRINLELDAASAQVQSSADRQIAEFLAASAQYDQTSETGREMESVALRQADGLERQPDTVVNITSSLLSVMRRQANVRNLTGITTLANWSQRHPVTNQQIIGCVRTWSAAAERDLRATRDGRPAAAPAAPERRQGGEPGIRSGREHMNSRDF
jgi:hypothetical protein